MRHLSAFKYLGLVSTFFTGLLMFSTAFAYVVENDIEYDYVNGTSLKVDVYRPSSAGTGLRPALVYTHGGCFNAGSKAEIPENVKKLADDGFTVFSVDYRLSTVAKYPAAVIDVQQAVRFIRKNSSRFQVDPNKIVSHGESAGGYLAAVLGVKPMPSRSGAIDQYSGRVQLVSDWYGRMDFTLTQSTGTDCAVSFLGLQRNSSTMSKFVEASITTHVNTSSAPFFIVQGTHDNQVNPVHSSAVANKLWNIGRSADLVYFEGAGHGFPDNTAWRLTRNHILKFFGRANSSVSVGSANAKISINSGRQSTPDISYFVSDRYFTGGFAYTYASSPTSNTSLPDLYLDVRAGGSFSYKVPRSTGVYRVGLYFAEKSPDVTGVNQRTMDVSFKFPTSSSNATEISVPVLSAFDIYALAGKNSVLRRQVYVISRSGNLKLGFAGRNGKSAILSAFEVDPVAY